MQTPPLMSFLYVSRVAPGLAEAKTVASITRQARVHNAIAGITGVLVFDGESFAQLVEGIPPSIVDLHHRILRDERHRDVQTLWFGEAGVEREYPGWELGYLLSEDNASMQIDRLRGLGEREALDAFREMVAALDTAGADTAG